MPPAAEVTKVEKAPQRYLHHAIDFNWTTAALLLGKDTKEVVVWRESSTAPSGTASCTNRIVCFLSSCPCWVGVRVTTTRIPFSSAQPTGRRSRRLHFLVAQSTDSTVTLVLSLHSHKSITPRLKHILDICYAQHVFLSLDPRNILVVHCANRRTRAAKVLACYLEFSRVMPTLLDCFRMFSSKRCALLDPTATVNNITRSVPLTTFFRNFDDCLEPAYDAQSQISLVTRNRHSGRSCR